MSAAAVLMLHGGRGRMGRAIAAIADDTPQVQLGDVVDRGDALPEQAAPGSVLVDFSTADAFDAALRWARERSVPFLSGTTGLTEAQMRALDAASTSIPVLHARNMSLGVAVLRQLVERASALLGEDFDVEIVEAHHRGKRDAPSGTALALVESVRAGRGELSVVSGREGTKLARGGDEIGVLALRGGSVAGDHDVHFFGPDERLTLRHHAERRDVFARGAVRAAQWLVSQPPGRYRMEDVLASRLESP